MYFPRGQHEDGLDALEMAVRTAEEELGKVTVTILGRDNPDWYGDYRRNFGWPPLF